ncbi:MAG TPA: flagellar basal body P-ring formation chaperone FlgA [Verrucomicrobiae bacterium]|nr:flagellar basal body P-ring formation chaperone FlgA [Verrucomicrobiae bacterium]
MLAVLFAQPAWLIAGQPGAFTLVSEAKADSSGIFLRQLLGPASVTVPQIRLAPPPALGQTTSLSRRQIIDLAKQALPELDTTNWAGADVVKVTRRTRPMDEEELTKMLRSDLQRDYVADRGELEIHLSRPWQTLEVPDEPLTLQITEIPASGVMPNVIIGFELWNGFERVGAWHLPLQARVWREIPVAHSPLTRGESLQNADISMERRDVLLQRDPCVTFPVTDPSLELTIGVPVGTPVWNRYVRSRPLVHRGELVEAVFQEGTLTISLKVETLEDGALGQIVRVRNPKTRRELVGKVQNEDLILIAL